MISLKSDRNGYYNIFIEFLGNFFDGQAVKRNTLELITKCDEFQDKIRVKSVQRHQKQSVS